MNHVHFLVLKTIVKKYVALMLIHAILAVILKIFDNSSPGWYSISSGILFVLFLQTGTLTLMTLMLTGVVRSGNVVTAIDYADFVEKEMPTRSLVA